MCIAAIRLEDVAALQLAQPSLGKMAVKEPAQPFWCYIPRLAARARRSSRLALGCRETRSVYTARGPRAFPGARPRAPRRRGADVRSRSALPLALPALPRLPPSRAARCSGAGAVGLCV